MMKRETKRKIGFYTSPSSVAAPHELGDGDAHGGAADTKVPSQRRKRHLPSLVQMRQYTNLGVCNDLTALVVPDVAP
jgi:hypothetical protein